MLADKLRLFDADALLEHAHTIPASWYRDNDIYEAERESVFGRTWLAAGLLDEVSRPESFATTTIAGEPILLVRDTEGQLRAFHNVCRHRAAPLQTASCGTASRLRCRYHGWTYDLSGQLRGVPEFDGVCDFRREDNGLVPFALDTWGPYAWVHEGMPRIGLKEYLLPLPQQFAPLHLERLKFVERRSYTLKCNWKVYVDNYLDGGYHVHTVHPGLAGVLDYASYRVEIAEYTSSQISPLKAEASEVGQVRGGENAYYCFVFPNLMLNVYRDYMDVNIVLPKGPDECEVQFDFFFAEGKQVKESIAVSEAIQQEDIDICEEVQRGLGSRAFTTGRYSVRREGAVYAFHRLLERHLQGG